MSEKLSEYYCDYCGEQYPEMEDGDCTFIEIDIRPYDLFCSYACVNNHMNDIENNEWANHDGNNKGLEVYYEKEIKNNWTGYPFRIVSADNLELIEEGKVGVPDGS